MSRPCLPSAHDTVTTRVGGFTGGADTDDIPDTLAHREPEPATVVEVISSEEYNNARRHGYAGTVAELMSETVAVLEGAVPAWNQRHWQMYLAPGQGTSLRPVNVVTG